jgi:hypothetical protein
MHLHEVSVGKATLSAGVFSVRCNALFLSDAQSAEGSSPQLAVTGAFSYSNCTGGCVFTEENLPVEIIMRRQGRGSTDLIPYVLEHVNCVGFVNCTFKERYLRGASRSSQSASRSSGALSFAKQSIRKESGALCLDRASIDITTRPLGKVYITGWE